ncbi:hypothetical protein KIW84_025379 [Lathyrus oleraceus]|uniref:Uncharacterized protein n=1 Tax=Pisum sativum TaxID=3888 RepID=A0A9D4YJE1_PEA|nr:hypothetical protein KIW84_025379 [Pisum sativum]
MPRCLSKQLDGNETEVLPTDRALGYAIVHASDSLETTLRGETPDTSEKSQDAQTNPNEQFRGIEAENIDERSKPHFPSLFGDAWLGSFSLTVWRCLVRFLPLEFTIKTLTGDLQVDDVADFFPAMTPNVNCPPKKEFLARME